MLMKTNLFKIALVAAVSVSATALPAKADKYDNYTKKKITKKETNVTVNVVSSGPRGAYYGRGPRPVYVAPRPVYVAPRPVYVAPRPVYVESRPVYASSVEVDVQRELAKRGYYGGVIDGDIGPRTRAAIRTYQVDKGLPVTGVIDGSLLRSLRLL
jgi:hypothetical protein